MNAVQSTAKELAPSSARRTASGSSPLETIYLYLKHFPATGMPLRVGTNKAVHGLASGMVVNNTNVEVWCEGEQESFTVTPEGYGIRCFAAHGAYRTLRLPPSLLARLKTLHPERDLFVLNGMFHPSVYALSRRLVTAGIRYVVAPHGPYHPELFSKKPYLKWPYWYLMERRALRDALALQQLDVRHESWARRLGVKVPIVATENGFLSRDVVARSELSWRTHGTVRVLYWGRISIHIKGLDVLLDGFDLAAQRHALHLTLQGPDWSGETPALRKLIARMQYSDSVGVLAPVFDVPPAKAIMPYDIMCIPSRFEGFGLAALDAMLSARVLMISASAGIAPHVERSGCGIVVEPTADSIRRGFDTLLAERERWPEMGLRGREYALEHLHWNGIARRTLAQYRRLLN
jgi:glycosyltransferase involved in cell wall biosynthesis